MSKPLVTILTPTYNCAKYLPVTIDSVLSQDYQPIAYIVLDDGSTDGTFDLLETRYQGKLHIIRHSNMGEQRTVNEGLKLVRGKYFMIVNADDPLLPSAVSALVEAMEAHPDVLCAYPDWNAINEDGSLKTRITTREWDFAYMVRHHTCLPSVGSMFRSTVIQEVGLRDTSFHWLGDFDYWLRIGLVGPMMRVPKTLACWRNRPDQASQDRDDRRAYEHATIMRKFYDISYGETTGADFYRWLSALLEIAPVEREALCWGYLVAACVCSNKRTTAHYIWQAVKVYPQLLWSLEFYDTVIKLIRHYLRR